VGSGGAPSTTMAWNLRESSRASATFLPFTASVMREALAVLMAHPWPWKRMSAMVSPSRSTITSTWSPQEGFIPPACLVAWGRTPKFLGLW